MITKDDLLKGKRIISISFPLSFEPILRIERYMYDLEKKLKRLFPDDLVDTKVPLDFDPRVPRFLLRNTRKKRFLEFSLDSATLKMQIVDDYSRKIHKGLEFFKSKLDEVFNALQEIIDPSFDEMGGHFHIEYSTKQLPTVEPDKFFCAKFLNKEQINEPFLYVFKITYVEDEKYFVNYITEAFETGKADVKLKSRTPPPGGKEIVKVKLRKVEGYTILDKGIRVLLEINNKYVTDGYSSTVTEIEPTSSIDDIFKIAQKK